MERKNRMKVKIRKRTEGKEKKTGRMKERKEK